ncbi:MAG: phosphate ABC transporter permease family protein, partial [Paracoccaceae bacterium]
MSVAMLLAVIGVLALAGFVLSRQRALASAGGNPRALHSLPNYYGWNGAIWVLVPALAGLSLWLIVQPMVVESRISADLPAALVADDSARALTMADVRRVAGGLDQAVAQGAMSEAEAREMSTGAVDVRAVLANVGVALGSNVSPEVLSAAQDYRAMTAWGAAARTILILVLAVAGLFWGVSRAQKDYRARIAVERVVLGLLALASSIAVFTTVGIIWSMASETYDFFTRYPIQAFFFSLPFSPPFLCPSSLFLLPLFFFPLSLLSFSLFF